MPLPADPTTTYAARGNAYGGSSGTTLAAGTATTLGSILVDFSAALGGEVQVFATFGTIAATAGLQVQVFAAGDSTPNYETTARTTFTLPAVAGARAQGVWLPNGKYSIQLTNLDATNGLTALGVTSNPTT